MNAQPQDWGRERRRARRFPLVLPVKVISDSPTVEAQFGFTADLSSGGALLFLPRAITPGTDLQFRIAIPQDLADHRSPYLDMIAHGKVARLVRRQAREGIAVEFLALTPAGEA